ncbi:hypothetical protein V8F06_013481 [Rhypophila decipiens]
MQVLARKQVVFTMPFQNMPDATLHTEVLLLGQRSHRTSQSFLTTDFRVWQGTRMEPAICFRIRQLLSRPNQRSHVRSGKGQPYQTDLSTPVIPLCFVSILELTLRHLSSSLLHLFSRWAPSSHQMKAVPFICSTKTRARPESTVSQTMVTTSDPLGGSKHIPAGESNAFPGLSRIAILGTSARGRYSVPNRQRFSWDDIRSSGRGRGEKYNMQFPHFSISFSYARHQRP